MNMLPVNTSPVDSSVTLESITQQQASGSADQSVCYHCLEAVPAYTSISTEIAGEHRPMCCLGCKAAAEFIVARGLDRFYQHRSELSADRFFADVAVADKDDSYRDSLVHWQFLDEAGEQGSYVHTEDNGLRLVRVEVVGLYCASCSWLIDRAIRARNSEIGIRVDVDAKCVYLETADPTVKFADIVATLAALGYSPRVCEISESHAVSLHNRDERLMAIKRIMVAGFGTMQVMTYAVASYVDVASMQSEYARFLALISLLVATIVVFYSGSPFFKNAITDIRYRRLGMDVPVALAIGGAYFPSVYSVLTASTEHIYFDSAVMFVFFLSLGRFLEMRSRHRLVGSEDDIENLIPNRIDVQRFEHDQVSNVRIAPQQIQRGDQMQLRAGDVVAFDATITGGQGEFDESMMTGESRAVLHATGDTVVAGSRVLVGTLMVESHQSWNNSTIVKIQRLLKRAERPGLASRNHLELVGRYFVAVVLGLTFVVGLIWSWYQPDRVFEVCLAMLVASCPCAFSLAAPVARSTAINTLKSVGVLITSDQALQSILQVSRWCFDKTGTISSGRMRIKHIVTVSGLAQDDCLRVAASLEQQSDHLLASAFQTVDKLLPVAMFSETTGQGVTGVIQGVTYYLGKREWVLSQSGASRKQLPTQFDSLLDSQLCSEVILASPSTLIAVYLIQDEIRPSASKLIESLQTQNCLVSVVSGDRESAVSNYAKALNISEYLYDQTPEDKLSYILAEQEKGDWVAMVGDGVNDAPVLAAANLGVALASGSDISVNNADIILLNGNLARLIDTQHVANKTQQITRQNLLWAFGYNLLVLPLAAFGFLTPWIAALGMSLSSLLVVLNASRIRRVLMP